MKAEIPNQSEPKSQQLWLLKQQSQRHRAHNTLILYGSFDRVEDLRLLQGLETVDWSSLKHVNLGANFINLEGVRVICGVAMPGLQDFMLRDNLIDTSAFRYMCWHGNWPQLRYLCLSKNLITETQSLEQANWPALQSINLFENRHIRATDIIQSMSKLIGWSSEECPSLTVHKMAVFKANAYSEMLKEINIVATLASNN